MEQKPAQARLREYRLPFEHYVLPRAAASTLHERVAEATGGAGTAQTHSLYESVPVRRGCTLWEASGHVHRTDERDCAHGMALHNFTAP